MGETWTRLPTIRNWQAARRRCVVEILLQSDPDWDGFYNVSGWICGAGLMMDLDFDTRDYYERSLFDAERGEFASHQALQARVLFEWSVTHPTMALKSPLVHALQLAATAPFWADVPWSGLYEGAPELCARMHAASEQEQAFEAWETEAVALVLASIGDAGESLRSVQAARRTVQDATGDDVHLHGLEYINPMLEHAERHLITLCH